MVLADTQPTKNKCTAGKNIKKSLQEFGDVTTLHGIRYITEPRAHIFERICWTLAILACAVWCSLELSKLFAKWKATPVITTFAQEAISVTNVPFPSVTICPESKVLRHEYDVEMNIDQFKQIMDGSLQLENKTEQSFIEAAGIYCETEDKNLSSRKLPVTEEHLYFIQNRIAPTIDDTFEKCVFHYYPQPCSELFQPVFTDYGLCFTFNMLNYKEIFNNEIYNSTGGTDWSETNETFWTIENGYEPLNSDSKLNNFRESFESHEYPRREIMYYGPTSGLVVYLKSIKGESQQYCSPTDSDNFRVTLNSPVEFPLPDRKYVHISPNTQAMISVRPDKIETDPSLGPGKYSPQQRGCVHPEEKSLFLFKNLTKQNCIQDTVFKGVLKSCNCTSLYLPMNNISYCDLNWDKNCPLDVEEIFNCLPSCNELRYRYHMSSSMYEPSLSSITNNTKNYQYTKLIVYFEESTYFPMRKSELYGITDLIANCGGLLGLFTGFSIISALEIIYFLTLRIMCQYRQRNNINKNEIE